MVCALRMARRSAGDGLGVHPLNQNIRSCGRDRPRCSGIHGGTMHLATTFGVIAAAAALLATLTAPVMADTKYPNLRGQWNTLSPRGSFDPDKPPGRKTLAPLTEEYQKIYDQNVADQLSGGHGWETSYQ